MEAELLDSTRLHINAEPQFFFDSLFIESVQYVSRIVHSPRKEPEPVLRKDKPWEHVTYFSTNTFRVIRDPQDGLFKCWYQDWSMGYEEFRRQQNWYDGSLGWPSRYLYAESEDGLRWTKPAVGDEEQGVRTNVVCGSRNFGSVHAAYVFLDPTETDPHKRYKMIFHQGGRWTTKLMWRGNVRLASSPDGLRWTKEIDLPDTDDVVTVAFDDESRTFLINTRHPEMYTVPANTQTPSSSDKGCMPPYYPNQPWRQNKRRVDRLETADFVHWTRIQPLLSPDDTIDNIDDAYYGMVQFKSGSVWIGLLTVFHMTRNTKDLHLLYSRDGRNFRKVQPGRAWIEPGPERSWDCCSAMTPSPPIVVGDELHVYYGGTANHHDWWALGMNENIDHPEAKDITTVTYSMGLARMKVDRFLSLSAVREREGVIVTRPFFTSGGTLRLNARCRREGYIAVQVANGETGSVLEGYARETCGVFQGDETAAEVHWSAGKGTLHAGCYRLHFFLRDADLFTFTIAERVASGSAARG